MTDSEDVRFRAIELFRNTYCMLPHSREHWRQIDSLVRFMQYGTSPMSLTEYVAPVVNRAHEVVE